MRIFVIGTVLTLILTGLGLWMRPRERAVSNVLFSFATIFAMMLIAAFFQWV